MKQLSHEQVSRIRSNALTASEAYDTVVLLDNNFCENAFGIRHIEFAAALGVRDELKAGPACFEALEAFMAAHANDYVFTWLGYDLKNETEKLVSENRDHIGFPECYAFVPEKLLVISDELRCVAGGDWVEELLSAPVPVDPGKRVPVVVKPRVSRDKYISDVQHIRQHIVEGDVYELNYCTEFYAEDAAIVPEEVYSRLMKKSPVPFAAFVKHEGRYLLCASPERFMTGKNGRVYSQPIKGTSPRGADAAEDDVFKRELAESGKERAENLMIVDLVRNDLARTAVTGSVRVDELFGIYRFPQVHQMISTVSSEPAKMFSPVEVIRQAFPMGSMTGAPKIMAMQLIEQYEETKRGLYSGATGYIAPGGSFDLNVVIRSIQYNSRTRYLNFEVGSAITFDSVPEQEYNECLLKARAMMEVLQGK